MHLRFMNKTTINIHIQVFLYAKFPSQLGKSLRQELLNCIVRLCVALRETVKLSSKMASPFCIPTNDEGRSKSSLAIGIVGVLDFTHSV